PVREEKDRLAIIEGLKDGTLDCIVTDHAPHSKKDKEVEYNLAAFGMSGIETSFALSYTYLVKSGIMGLADLMRLMSYNPAKVLSLQGGEIKAGEVADLTIVDLNCKYVIDGDKFYSKGKNTPFNGYEVYGKVCATIVDGDVKYINKD
ncbi:MAG: amidohydrolase family protein, partial [Candidatus Coproplasma sp.]